MRQEHLKEARWGLKNMTTEPHHNELIAVGLDGSEASWKALNEAVRLAKFRNDRLHIVSVQESADASYSAQVVLAEEQTAHENLERIQIKARMLAESEGVSVVTAIAFGGSASALAEYVKKEKINLLIVGDTGHSSIWGTLLGTTAEKIVRTAPCSVLVVR